MGFAFSQDGECRVCKKPTNKFCDACRRYICDEHQVKVEIAGTVSEHIFCKECYEKGKRPINATSKGMHPHYG
jgi:hypothetical protein